MKLGIALATVLVIAGCLPVARPQAPATVTIPAQAAELYALVNEVRAQGHDCGPEGRFPATHPLTWNTRLARAAERHASDLASREEAPSHRGSDGSDVNDRVDGEGYTWSVVGENIAFGFGYVMTPEETLAGWLDSPGHCRNLMHPDFREIGVARTGEYWVQVFGTPR